MMMMTTTTLLNDLAIAIVTDKSHADKLISILYKKKTVYKREDEDRIINVRACMRSYVSVECACAKASVDDDEIRKESRRKSFQRKRVTISSIV
jgi:hypothetical protein